jgi:hypothetical protein
MACKTCNLVKCGCQDSYLTTPPPCPTPSDCPDVQPCSEVFDAQCVVYTGLTIICGDVEIVIPDTNIADALNSITSFFCDQLTVNLDITCGDDVIVPAGTSLEDAMDLLSTYVCNEITTITNEINDINNVLITGSSVSAVDAVAIGGCVVRTWTVQLLAGVNPVGAPIVMSTPPICPPEIPCDSDVVTELNPNPNTTDSIILCRTVVGPFSGSDTAQIPYIDFLNGLAGVTDVAVDEIDNTQPQPEFTIDSSWFNEDGDVLDIECKVRLSDGAASGGFTFAGKPGNVGAYAVIAVHPFLGNTDGIINIRLIKQGTDMKGSLKFIGVPDVYAKSEITITDFFNVANYDISLQVTGGAAEDSAMSEVIITRNNKVS